jgi:two-component system, sensor histidine kinase PdtaS
MIYKSLKYNLYHFGVLISFSFGVFSQSVSPLQAEKLRYANSVLKIALDEEDTAQIAEAYYLFGKIEEAKHNFQKSNEYFLKSLKIQEKRGESYQLGRLYLRLSELEFRQDHYTETFKYVRKAKEIYERNKSEKGLKECEMAIGQFFSKSWQVAETGVVIKPNNDSALHYYRKFESRALADKDELGLASIRLLIGQILLTKNDPECVFILEESMAGYAKYYTKGSPLIHAKLLLANAYITFGKLEKSFKLIQEAQKLNRIAATAESFVSIEMVFIQYYQAKGDWKQAFEHLQRKIELDKETQQADRNGAVTKLNIEYETDKKDKLLIEQKKNLSLQKRFLWVVGSFLILMLVISYVLFQLFKKNKAISQRNAILLKEQNHRVKNNLQVVSSLLTLQSKLLEDNKAKQAVDEGQRRVETMAILHRQLYSNRNAIDKIDMEVFIMELTEIITESYGFASVEILYEITQKELDADQAVFMGLIFNELISNACKYAFPNHEKPMLKISFYDNQNQYVLKVKDNGKSKIPFKKNTTELLIKNQSFGMVLINMMVLQLNGSIEYSYQKGSEFIVKSPK